MREGGTYDATALDGLELVEASPGRVACRLVVARRHANHYGTLHGGCIGERRRGGGRGPGRNPFHSAPTPCVVRTHS